MIDFHLSKRFYINDNGYNKNNLINNLYMLDYTIIKYKIFIFKTNFENFIFPDRENECYAPMPNTYLRARTPGFNIFLINLTILIIIIQIYYLKYKNIITYRINIVINLTIPYKCSRTFISRHIFRLFQLNCGKNSSQ